MTAGGAGRSLPPTSAFAGDDGAADERLAAALGAHTDGEGTLAQVVAALSTARVLVPVLARLEEAEVRPDGLTGDKQASTGVVALRSADGRTALPVFSSVAAMQAWGKDARPIPAPGPLAAASAVQEGWDILVVDPAGAAVVIPRPAVRSLAAGTQWEPAVEAGEVRPDVVAAIRRALTGVESVVAVDAVPGRACEVAVVLGVRSGLDRPTLDRLTAAAGRRLAADELVAAAIDSIEMRVTAAH